jgi:methylglutaconyl-CoA hydratase
VNTWVRTTIEDRLATVTLDRPDVHNAFNDDFIRQLTETFTRLGEQALVAVVLRAEGRSFCAGADLNWMRQMVDWTQEENEADARRLGAMLAAIRHCPYPVVARVHGAALGGGVGLVAAADMAVALSAATFALSEVKLGIIPAVIAPYVLEKIGAGPARRYFLTGERFSAAEAHRIGLLHEVAESVEDLDVIIDQWTDALRQNGPQAVAAAKVLISEVDGYDWDRAATVTARRIAERRVSAEGQEGMRAFLEKRRPAWV